MRAAIGGLLVSLAIAAPALAQEPDRSLERVRLGLQRPSSLVLDLDPARTTLPRTLGVVTLVPPTRPGEIVRVSIPIGELMSRASKGVRTANRRRQEAAARREVAAALEAFKPRR